MPLRLYILIQVSLPGLKIPYHLSYVLQFPVQQNRGVILMLVSHLRITSSMISMHHMIKYHIFCVQVVRCCLEHASSVAKTFLMSDCVVVEIKEPEPVPMGNPMDNSGMQFDQGVLRLHSRMHLVCLCMHSSVISFEAAIVFIVLLMCLLWKCMVSGKDLIGRHCHEVSTHNYLARIRNLSL